jgi:hypothetical protein
VPASAHDERLARLLRLLRPAPASWVARAKRIALAYARATRLTDRDLELLTSRLAEDALFREQFDADPVAAARAAGLRDLAVVLAAEVHELIALAEQIATDESYRAELGADPIATLSSAGIPVESSEQLLEALGVGEDVHARVPEVVAHVQLEQPIRARLVNLLLGTTSVASKLHAAARSLS